MHACSGRSSAIGNAARQVLYTCNASCVDGTAAWVAYIVAQAPTCQLTLLLGTLVATTTSCLCLYNHGENVECVEVKEEASVSAEPNKQH